MFTRLVMSDHSVVVVFEMIFLYVFYYVINVSVCTNYFSSGFICGARLAVIFWGRGAQVRRHPGSTYWVTNQMSLGLKHFVLEGVM